MALGHAIGISVSGTVSIHEYSEQEASPVRWLAIIIHNSLVLENRVARRHSLGWKESILPQAIICWAW